MLELILVSLLRPVSLQGAEYNNIKALINVSCMRWVAKHVNLMFSCVSQEWQGVVGIMPINKKQPRPTCRFGAFAHQSVPTTQPRSRRQSTPSSSIPACSLNSGNITEDQKCKLTMHLMGFLDSISQGKLSPYRSRLEADSFHRRRSLP